MKALHLAEILEARAIVPITNGELEQGGLLSTLIRSEGSLTDFRRLLDSQNARRNRTVECLDVRPGVELILSNELNCSQQSHIV